MRRVVVTGMGMVTPLGDGVDTNWQRLIAAESGIRAIQAFDTSDLATKIAGEVRVCVHHHRDGGVARLLHGGGGNRGDLTAADKAKA